MSKKMKVTRTYAQRVDGGALITDGTGHPAVIMWATDYVKLRRAWRLVEKVVATDIMTVEQFEEARRIVGRK